VALVRSLYPALLAPLGAALRSPVLRGADVFDHLCGGARRVLDAFDAPGPLYDKLRALDDELGAALGALLGLAHRAALHNAPAGARLADWLSSTLEAWPVEFDEAALGAALDGAPATGREAALRAAAPDLAAQWRAGRDNARSMRHVTAARRRRRRRPPSFEAVVYETIAALRCTRETPAADAALAGLGYVRVDAGADLGAAYGVFAARRDAAPAGTVAEARIFFGEAEADAARDLGWLAAGPALPRGRVASLRGDRRPYLLYRRDDAAADPLTFSKLRTLLADHGF